MTTIDFESPCLSILIPSGVCCIGTEHLGDSLFVVKGGKRYKRSRVNIYASKRFFTKEGYFQGSVFSYFRTIYEIKDAPYKQKMQRETEKTEQKI